jgi:ornithine cyclodeaminase/alanine dehydrogenase-like protein (mu-crystallin family)
VHSDHQARTLSPSIKMLVLTSADITTLLLSLSPAQFTRLTTAMKTALTNFTTERLQQSQSSASSTATKQIHQPPRTHFTVLPSNTTTLTMPVSNSINTTAVKTVAVAPNAPPRGAVTVFDIDGQLRGVLSAEELTAFRTALVSCCVLGASPWAAGSEGGKGKEHVLVVFGGGRQAEWHVRLALRTARVGRVVVVLRSKERGEKVREGWLKDVQGRYEGVGFETLVEEGHGRYQEELRRLLVESDIICGTTPSTKPLFPAEYLGIGGDEKGKKGRFISLIGSYKPSMVEVDEETLLSGVKQKVIVDSIEDCLIESGELIKAGRKPEQLVEAGEIFDGRNGLDVITPKNGENVVFKCVGMGLMDLTTAQEVLAISEEAGNGTKIRNF